MNQRRYGYAMLEMLAAMSLVGVFLLVGGTLVNQVFAIQREAARMEWATSRMDHALREVRKDMWDTAHFSRVRADSVTVILNSEPSRAVSWRFEPEPSETFPDKGWLIRESSTFKRVGTEPITKFAKFEVPFRVTFAQNSSLGLSLDVDGQTLWLPSQVRLGQSLEMKE